MYGQLCEPLHALLADSTILPNVPSDEHTRKVIVKRAPKQRLNNEREVLEILHGHPCIRPMIDISEDPPSLVLKFLDENLLKLSGQKRIEGPDLKLVARSLLQALAALHEHGFVHTGKIVL